MFFPCKAAFQREMPIMNHPTISGMHDTHMSGDLFLLADFEMLHFPDALNTATTR
jgi:hypothetical protein